MRLARPDLGLLVLLALLGSTASAEAVRVSLFNGLPHRIEVVRLLDDGGEHRPWKGPMESGSRWRIDLPAGARMEFRRGGVAIASLQVGPEPSQGHVIRLPGVQGPVPPPPPRGQRSEFPGWRSSRSVRPASLGPAPSPGR